VTPVGAVQPPSEVRYERGNVTTVRPPLVDDVFVSTHDGDPVIVRADPAAAPVTRFAAVAPEPSLKSQ
jgi:hypothetical protein